MSMFQKPVHFWRQMMALGRVQLAYNLHFRAEAMLWVTIDLVQFAVLLFVIQAIYGNDVTINGITLGYSIQYFLIVIIVNTLTHTHFEEWLGGLIIKGKIEMQLIRPVTANFYYGWTAIVRKMVTAIIKLPILAVFFILTTRHFDVPFPQLQTNQTVALVALLLGSLLVQTAISLIIGWLTFWFENASSLIHFKGILLGLFSGTMLPPQLFPEWLQHVTYALPLKYFGTIPVQVWLGSYVLTASDAVQFGTFALGVFLILQLTYHYGIRRYVSAGG